MSAQENKDFIKRYLGELSGKPKPPSVIDRYVSDSGLKEHILMFEAAFPGYQLAIDDMVAERDLVAIRATFHGIHQQDFMGVPATGKEVSTSAMVFYQIEGEKIVASWLLADSMNLMQQLSAAPATAKN